MTLEQRNVIPLTFLAAGDDFEVRHWLTEMDSVIAHDQAEIDVGAEQVRRRALGWRRGCILPNSIESHEDIATIPETSAHMSVLASDRWIHELTLTAEA